MMYRSDSPEAAIACEYCRTGYYGEAGYIDTDTDCMCCGADNPYRFYYNDEDKMCVGCTECVSEADVNLYKRCPVCDSKHQDGFYISDITGECVGCTSCIRQSRTPDGEDW